MSKVYLLVSIDENDVNVEAFSTPAKAFEALSGPNRCPQEWTDENENPLNGWDGESNLDVWAEGYSDKLYTLMVEEVS